ncbi:MAG TPA: hypothetical protein VGX23_38180 [Actinocrinis sp.]|nr:hypothetical protein [Actinocrinis sp.]
MVALTMRLPARARRPIALAAVGVCMMGVTAAFAWPGGNGSAAADPVSAAPVAVPELAGFSAARLASGLGAEYGFRFMAATAPTDRGSVDMATAQDSTGDHLRVIVFGRAPEPVHGLACEFTPAAARSGATPGIAAAATGDAAAPPNSAAGFLSDCARLGSGQAQAAAAAGWVARTQARLAALPAAQSDPGRLTASARFGPAGYVLRRLPQTGEWIVAVTGPVR